VTPNVDNAIEEIKRMREELLELKSEVNHGVINQARLSKVSKEFNTLMKELGMD